MFGLKKKSRKVELVSPVNGKMIRYVMYRTKFLHLK